MENIKIKKLEAYVKAMEKASELELQLIIAQKEAEEAKAEYLREMEKRIYCGTEEQVGFFEYILTTLGLDIDYEVEDVDGELEIVINEADPKEINYCKGCGKEITEYEQVDWEGNELRQTYHCSCGYCGEQTFDIYYKQTEEVER